MGSFRLTTRIALASLLACALGGCGKSIYVANPEKNGSRATYQVKWHGHKKLKASNISPRTVTAPPPERGATPATDILIEQTDRYRAIHAYTLRRLKEKTYEPSGIYTIITGTDEWGYPRAYAHKAGNSDRNDTLLLLTKMDGNTMLLDETIIRTYRDLPLDVVSAAIGNISYPRKAFSRIEEVYLVCGPADTTQPPKKILHGWAYVYNGGQLPVYKHLGTVKSIPATATRYEGRRSLTSANIAMSVKDCQNCRLWTNHLNWGDYRDRQNGGGTGDTSRSADAYQGYVALRDRFGVDANSNIIRVSGDAPAPVPVDEPAQPDAPKTAAAGNSQAAPKAADPPPVAKADSLLKYTESCSDASWNIVLNRTGVKKYQVIFLKQADPAPSAAAKDTAKADSTKAPPAQTGDTGKAQAGNNARQQDPAGVAIDPKSPTIAADPHGKTTQIQGGKVNTTVGKQPEGTDEDEHAENTEDTENADQQEDTDTPTDNEPPAGGNTSDSTTNTSGNSTGQTTHTTTSTPPASGGGNTTATTTTNPATQPFDIDGTLDVADLRTHLRKIGHIGKEDCVNDVVARVQDCIKTAEIKTVTDSFTNEILRLTDSLSELSDGDAGQFILNKRLIQVYNRKGERIRGEYFEPVSVRIGTDYNRIHTLLITGNLYMRDGTVEKMVVGNREASLTMFRLNTAFLSPPSWDNSRAYHGYTLELMNRPGEFIAANEAVLYLPKKGRYHYMIKNQELYMDQSTGWRVDVAKRSLNDYLSLRLFLDPFGFLSNTPNGMLQAEGHVTLPMNIRQPMGENNSWRKITLLPEQEATFSTVYAASSNSGNRIINPDTVYQGDSLLSSPYPYHNYVNNMDFFRKHNVQFNYRISLFAHEMKMFNLWMHFRIGFDAYGANSQLYLDTLPNRAAPEARSTYLAVLYPVAGFKFEFRPDAKFGLYTTFDYLFFSSHYFTGNSQYNSRKNVDFLYGSDWMLRNELTYYARVGERSAGGLFFRMTNYVAKYFKNNDIDYGIPKLNRANTWSYFPQILIGYSTNINAFIKQVNNRQ